MAPDPFNVKRRVEWLDGLRRQLLPLPVIDRAKPIETAVFEPYRRRGAAGLRGKRIGLVAADRGAAAVAMVGVRRAFEEAGVEVEAISTVSSSVIWGAMWAAGLDAHEMAEFSLSWQPQNYLGIQWTRLPRFAWSAVRGFTGLATDEALEQLFDRRLWHMSAGETEVAFHTAVYELESREASYFGTAETPELTLGELVRIAVAPPHPAEAVRVEGRLFVDGSLVDAFPADPLIADGGFDHVFALAPPPQAARHGARTELARRSRRLLGESLRPIEPIFHDESHGNAFYDLFLDRARWPDLMRRGHSSALEAIAPFRRRRSA